MTARRADEPDRASAPYTISWRSPVAPSRPRRGPRRGPRRRPLVASRRRGGRSCSGSRSSSPRAIVLRRPRVLGRAPAHPVPTARRLARLAPGLARCCCRSRSAARRSWPAPALRDACAAGAVLLVGCDGRRRCVGRRPRPARRRRRPRRLGHPEERVPPRRRHGSAHRSSSSAGSPATSPSTASTSRAIRPATCCSCRSSTGSDSAYPSVVAAIEIARRRAGGAGGAGRRARGRRASARRPAAWRRSWPRRRSRSGWRPAPTRSTPASAHGRSRWSSLATGRVGSAGRRARRRRWAAVRRARVPLVRARAPRGDPARGRVARRRRARPLAVAAARGRGRRRCVRRSPGSGGSRASPRPAPATTPGSRRAGPTTPFLLVNLACLGDRHRACDRRGAGAAA